MHKLFTVCTKQVRSAYIEHAASGLPNPSHLEGDVRFDQAQDQQVVTTRSLRIKPIAAIFNRICNITKSNFCFCQIYVFCSCCFLFCFVCSGFFFGGGGGVVGVFFVCLFFVVVFFFCFCFFFLFCFFFFYITKSKF